MTYKTSDDADYEPPQALSRRGLSLITIYAILATCSVASAFIWRAYGNNLAALPSFAVVNGPSAASSASAAEKSVELQAFQAFQLQITEQTQGAMQLLASQQAEIKRLSDQVVDLSGKIDALQRLATPVTVPGKAESPVRKIAPTPAAKHASNASRPSPPLQLSR